MDEQRVLRVGTLALLPLGLVAAALGASVGDAVMVGLGVGTVLLGSVLYVLFRGRAFDTSQMGRAGLAVVHALEMAGLFACLAYVFASGPILVLPSPMAAVVGTALGLVVVGVQSWLFGRQPLGYLLALPASVCFLGLLWVLPAASLVCGAVIAVGRSVAVGRKASA